MPSLDPTVEFQTLCTRTLDAIRAHFPYKGSKNRLELTDLHMDERAASPSDIHHHDNVLVQRQAKERGGTWAVPVVGTLTLVRIADNVVLDRKTMTIARIPKMTRRLSYIIGGHERQHDKLFRSKARPYHIVANDGSVVARWNIEKGGSGFDIAINPKNLQIVMHYGTSTIGIVPILLTLGIEAAEMKAAWGDRIYAANASAKMADLAKIHKTTMRFSGGNTDDYVPPPMEQIQTVVRDVFKKSTVRPDAMLSAFGKEFTHVDGESLLLSTKRLIGIVSKREEEDDRQSLSAKDFASTEDFVAEHLARVRNEINMKIRNKIDSPDGKLDGIIQSSLYTRYINGTFEPAQRPEQTNPVSMVSGHLRTTIRGAFGGVQGERVNLDKDRLINPTHSGFIGVIQTPESDAGISLILPTGVKRQGRDLTARVWNCRTHTFEWVTAGQVEFKNAVQPDQVIWKDGKPYPIAPRVVAYDKNRKDAKIDWKDADYIMPSPKASLEMATNLVPFVASDQGSRAMMAAKQMEQAVSVKYREAPLVQAKSDGDASYDQIMGKMSGHHSPVDGVVTVVTKDMIKIKASGDRKEHVVMLYDHFPVNGGRLMIHSEPLVAVGAKVTVGQPVADTNHTRNGVMALGLNARVAYIPAKGDNFEDGIQISESFAKRMTSEHLHTESAMIAPTMILNKKRWLDYARPDRVTSARLAKLDTDGVIKEGQKVTDGDVLIALLAPTANIEKELLDVSKKLARDFRDAGVYWQHEFPGTIVRVIRSADRVTVYVRTEEIATVGDKMAGRHGNKGIISRIIPDSDMPHDKAGKHVEVLLNTAGVVSRMNVGQVYETMAGRIAKKTGKPYLVDNFAAGVDNGAKIQKDLIDAGMDPDGREELFDPKTGASLGRICSGYQQLQKLVHLVDKKITARSFGGAYTPHGAPPSGSGIPGGGQKMDQLAMYGMLAHGAVHNLREAYSYKSDADQDNIWVAIQSGQPLPTPKPGRVFNHFQDYLRAMGVHVGKTGSQYQLAPMSDAHTQQISNGALKLPDKMLYAKGVRTIEEVGGLFDPKITGGIKGNKWSHLELAAPIPNPVFEVPIQRLIGCNEREWQDLLANKNVPAGKSGFDIIHDRLAAINVERDLAEAEKQLPTLSGALLSKTYQRVRYLRALKATGMRPVDAYMNKVLPVLPPALRRIDTSPDGTQIIDDLNVLYRNVAIQNDAMKKAHPSDTGVEQRHKLRASLYDSVKALRAVGQDQGEGRLKKHATGLMERMVGTGGPKTSFFHSEVMGRRQNASARTTIIPMPELHLDEVGVPLPVAMEIFKAFVVRDLSVRGGHSPLDARQMVKEFKPDAVRALHNVAARTPVLLKRDPVLHRYSVQSFNVRVISDKAIGLHPMVVGGFNADFDGDQMAIFVPISDTAIAEAGRLKPSVNLFSSTHWGLVPKLSQDSLVGVYQCARWGQRLDAKTAATPIATLLADMWKGKHKCTAIIVQGGRETTLGRIELHNALPAAMKPYDALLYDKNLVLDGKGCGEVLSIVGKKYPKDFAPVIDRWKDIGHHFSYMNGSSFSLQDFNDIAPIREKILAPCKVEEDRIRASTMPQKEKDAKIIAMYLKANADIEKTATAHLKATGKNELYTNWIESGARGGWTQFGQLGSGPLLVTDSRNQVVPIPITEGFGKGLSFSNYMRHLHGARKGTIDRAKGTAEPGALTKDIINTALPVSITAHDCMTTEGERLSVDEVDIEGRHTAGAQTLPDGTTIANNTVIDNALIKRLRTAHATTVNVRSALHCKQRKGICAVCYGVNENGKYHTDGVQIGVIAGHGLGEPVTQLSMKCSAGIVTLADGSAVALDDLYFSAYGEPPTAADTVGGGVYAAQVIDSGETTEVTHIEAHLPVVPMRFIRTRGGRPLVVQEDHPLWVYDAQGRESVKPAGEVTTDDYLRVDEAAVLAADLANPDIPAYVAGFFLAEGSTRIGNGTVAYEGRAVSSIFTQQDGPRKDKLIKCLASIEGVSTHLRSRSEDVQVYWPAFAEKMRAMVLGKTAYQKRLPLGFNRWTRDYQAELLAAWIDGDGTTYHSGSVTVARLYTSSFVALQQAEVLCRRLGLRFSPSYVSRPDERVKIQSRHAAFAVEIRFDDSDWSRKVHGASIKLSSIGPLRYARVKRKDGQPYERVSCVNTISRWILPVYDVKTSTAGFTCGTLRNHNTFHTGGVASSDATLLDSFVRAKQLFMVPKDIPNEAVLSKLKGTVTAITPDHDIGGFHVHVGNVDHYVGAQLRVLVQVGAVVQPGTQLSNGPVNPRRILEITGDTTQVKSFMARDIAATYKQGGGKVRRRNVEVIVAAQVNLCRILEAPPASGFLRGQLRPTKEIDGYNQDARAEKRPVVIYEPVLKPMTSLPLDQSEDWMARMNYARLEETLTQGAAMGFTSDVAGDHMIPRIAHGALLGVPQEHVRKIMATEKDTPQVSQTLYALPSTHIAPKQPRGAPVLLTARGAAPAPGAVPLAPAVTAANASAAAGVARPGAPGTAPKPGLFSSWFGAK